MISLIVLGLFTYWFGVANRHVVFLYEHRTVGIPAAQPFDALTSSRYWMSGLVAAGAVMVLYVAANRGRAWRAGRRGGRFAPSAWWHVWLLCAVPVGAGVIAITATLNAPALPLSLAAACAIATLLGLALALLPGAWAAERPVDLAWLAADGVGLMPALLLVRAVELPGRGLSISPPAAWLVAAGWLVAGAMWLAAMSALRAWRRRPTPGASALFLAGLGLSYVLLPLGHHLYATPAGYRYISAASNFFAFDPALQLAAVALAAGLAAGAVLFRRRVLRWLSSHQV